MHCGAPQANCADTKQLGVDEIDDHERSSSRCEKPGAVDPLRLRGQAKGKHRPTTARDQTSPMTATGIPNTIDSGLVVTNVQFTTPVSGHARADGSA